MVTIEQTSDWEQLERLLRVYEGRGFKCFPVKPNKLPWESWKKYLDENADVRVDRFRRTFESEKPFLIAGIPGSNIVLDIDDPAKFHAALQGAETDFSCPQAFTPSGGRHLYFRNTGDVDFQAYGWGEIRTGDKHYVVLPGSGHPADYSKDERQIRAEYAWAPGSVPLDTWEGDLPELPSLLLELASRESRPAAPISVEHTGRASILDGVPQGQRNQKLFGYACRCRDRGYELNEAVVLLGAAASNCSPPYPSDGEETVDAMVRRVYATYPFSQRTSNPTSTIRPLDLDAAIRQISELPGGLPTCWPSLNDDGVRFRAGELSVVAARLGHGKSAYLLNLACEWLHSDAGTVVFISLEMPLADIVCKLITVETGWWTGGFGPSVHELRDYFREGWEARDRWDVQEPVLQSAIDELRATGRNLWPLYAPLIDVDQIAETCRNVHQQTGKLAAILIDYVQLIQAPQGQYDRRDVAIGVICQALKGLSVELGCPVITAAQINREGVSDTNLPVNASLEDQKTREILRKRRPQVHQIREADTIGQYADMVLGIQNLQEDILGALPVEDRREKRQAFGPLEVSTLKSRFGTPTVAKLTIYGKTGTILDPSDDNQVGAHRRAGRGEEVGHGEL